MSSFTCNLFFVIQSCESDIQHCVNSMISCSCEIFRDLQSWFSLEKLGWDGEWWCTITQRGVQSTKRIESSSGPLLHSKFQYRWNRRDSGRSNNLSAFKDVGPKLRQSSVGDAKGVMCGVILSKAACWEINKGKKMWLSSKAVRKIVHDFKKSCFSAVGWVVSELMRVEEMIIFKMLAQLEKDDFSVIFKKMIDWRLVCSFSWFQGQETLFFF